MTTTEIILKYLNSVYPRFLFNYELMSKGTPFGFISHKADTRLRDLCKGYGEKASFRLKITYHNEEYELEGAMVDGKRVYRARTVKRDNDIDSLFKSVPIMFSADYANLMTAYRKYQKAKTENDKKRFANDVRFYYGKLCPDMPRPQNQAFVGQAGLPASPR